MDKRKIGVNMVYCIVIYIAFLMLQHLCFSDESKTLEVGQEIKTCKPIFRWSEFLASRNGHLLD